MLQPKRTKYRKMQTGRNRGSMTQNVEFGDYGLKCAGRRRISARQIEAARRVIARVTKRAGKLWIRIFPDKPITKKPLEVRQGKGKGGVEYWVALVQPGRIMFELGGLPEEIAIEAFEKAAAKMGVKWIIVKRTVM